MTELTGRTVSYGYDSIYRLTSEMIASDPNSVNGAVSYTYDPVGNRTQKTSTLPGYPGGLTNYNANDQVSTDTYDAGGNTTASNGVGYVYDFENHLVQAGGGITIVYDGDGNRVSKTVAGVTTNYLVDDQNPTGYTQVVYARPAGRSAQIYVYGLELISEEIGNTTAYYVYDGHGSVRALTNTTGTVTDTYDYDAFGNLIHSTGTTPNNFLFAGEQFDPDLDLYFNRARYLSVSTGRFVSQDPVEGGSEDPVTLHRYLYAGDDPTDNIDPSGEDFSIGEVSAGLDMFNTINASPGLNFNTILLSIPKTEMLYVRSFAPWKKFGAYPPLCLWNCFSGDNRGFTTSRSVTSRINGIIQFLLPSMLAVSQQVYSDPSHDIIGRTATGDPTMSVTSGGGSLHMEMAGPNPLAPGSPDIDTKLDISLKVSPGQACFTGHLHGDAFPNAEVFVVNSKDQATMLHTFQTTGGKVTGPLHFLPFDFDRDMGSFSNKCAPE